MQREAFQNFLLTEQNRYLFGSDNNNDNDNIQHLNRTRLPENSEVNNAGHQTRTVSWLSKLIHAQEQEQYAQVVDAT